MDIVQQLVQRHGAQGSVGLRLVRSRSSGFRRLALGQLLLHLFGQILHKGAGQRIVRHLFLLSSGDSRLLRGRQVLRTELQKGDVQIEDLCAESV